MTAKSILSIITLVFLIVTAILYKKFYLELDEKEPAPGFLGTKFELSKKTAILGLWLIFCIVIVVLFQVL